MDFEDRPATSWMLPAELFRCSVTNSLFTDPFIAPDGNTYSRDGIQQALKVKEESPNTRQRLKHNDLRKNILVDNILKNLTHVKDEKGRLVIAIPTDKLKNPKTGKFYIDPVVDIILLVK